MISLALWSGMTEPAVLNIFSATSQWSQMALYTFPLSIEEIKSDDVNLIQGNQLSSQATTADHWSDLYFILGNSPGLYNRLAPTPSGKVTKSLGYELRFGVLLGIS